MTRDLRLPLYVQDTFGWQASPFQNRLMRNAKGSREFRHAAGRFDCSFEGWIAHGRHSNHRLRISATYPVTDSYLERGNQPLHGQPVKNELAQILFNARQRLGMTQQDMAAALNVSRPAIGQWESGDKRPSTKNLVAAFNLLGIPLTDLSKIDPDLLEYENPRDTLHRKDEEVFYRLVQVHRKKPSENKLSSEEQPSIVNENVRIALDAPNDALNAQISLPLDVPVLGITVGGVDHDFQFNGETVDHVRRPPGIASARKAYATYVVGDSMYPAHSEGALVYVNPDKPPSIGDDVVIEIIHEDTRGDQTGDQAGRAYIKRLVRRTPTKIIVQQFNPPEEIEFDREEVKAMHRVVPWNELLGV